MRTLDEQMCDGHEIPPPTPDTRLAAASGETMTPVVHCYDGLPGPKNKE
jgi:hypothetical protein